MGVTHIHWLYYTGLIGIIAGLSLSKPAISIGLIICGIAWLAELNFRERILKTIQHPFFKVSLLLILLHLVGLCWSQNVSYGLKDIKTKLPLLVIPILFIGSNAFAIVKELRFVKTVFMSSLILCILLSFGIYLGWIKPGQYQSNDIRTMIFGVSGVRLALFISLANCMLLYEMYHSKQRMIQLLMFLLLVGFMLFLNFIESGTGILFMVILVFVSALYFMFKKWSLQKALAVVGITVVILTSMAFTVYNYAREVLVKKDDPVKAKVSKYGEPYSYIKELMYYENGYIVGDHVAHQELEKTWNKRSKIPYLGFDHTGQALQSTLVRYLNSKGVAKDREGVESLTEQDIRNIENGIANFNYVTKSGWQKRIMQIVYEFETYMNGQTPFGNSVTQRLEYWKIGWRLFSQNQLLGIGTGDLKDAFESEYKNYGFKIDERYKLRAHNQYLTMAIAFGLLGVVVFIAYSTSLVWLKGARNSSYLAICFLIIMLLSFVSEDTLETQSGVTFIAFFHTLFALGGKASLKSVLSPQP